MYFSMRYLTRAYTNLKLKVDMPGVRRRQREYNQSHMLVAIDFVPTRRKKIAVDVVPANWQLYIEH